MTTSSSSSRKSMSASIGILFANLCYWVPLTLQRIVTGKLYGYTNRSTRMRCREHGNLGVPEPVQESNGSGAAAPISGRSCTKERLRTPLTPRRASRSSLKAKHAGGMLRALSPN